MAKKLEPLTKLKLVYLIELLIFVVLFSVLASLLVAKVILVADWKRYLFTYATLIGGVWILIDFVWTLNSPKKRAKSSLVDKGMLVPAAIGLIAFDIYAFAQGLVHIPEGQTTNIIFNYALAIDFYYLAAVYLFESVYHWYRPVPALMEALEVAEGEPEDQPKEENPEAAEASVEEKEAPSEEEKPEEKK